MELLVATVKVLKALYFWGAVMNLNYLLFTHGENNRTLEACVAASLGRTPLNADHSRNSWKQNKPSRSVGQDRDRQHRRSFYLWR